MSTNTDTPVVATGVTPERLKGLFRWNLVLGFLHIIQALAIASLSASFTIGILVGYVDGPPEAGLSTLVLSDSGFGVSAPFVIIFS